MNDRRDTSKRNVRGREQEQAVMGMRETNNVKESLLVLAQVSLSRRF